MEGSKRADTRAVRSEKQELRQGRWTEEEKVFLATHWGRRSDAEIAAELERSQASVAKMARELFRKQRTGPWTSVEVGYLEQYLGATTVEVIARILGRDQSEVESRIFELRRVRRGREWQREEVAQLKRMYGTRRDEDLARVFGRSVESLRRKARSLRLAKDKAFLRQVAGRGASRMPRWSDEEIAILAEIYPTTANLEIAKRLDRSVKSVVSKAHHMGLKKGKERLQEMGRENVSLRYRNGDTPSRPTDAPPPPVES